MIINNNKGVEDVLSEYFEVGNSDVYHTMRVNRGDSGETIVKCVNMSEVYKRMSVDVLGYVQSERYIKDMSEVDTNGKSKICACVNEYTRNRYDGLTLEYVDMVLNNKGESRSLSSERVYEIMIEAAGGVGNIDWMNIYENVTAFRVNRDDVWMVLVERLLSSEIYEYYVNRYNIRNVRLINDYVPGKNERYILFDYDGGEYKRGLDNLMRNKRQWWRKMCGDNSRGRGDIKDYDKLLAGRSENLVLPDYCPVFKNIRLNYTQIDFSNGKHIQQCSEVAGYSDCGEAWSPASIDRIDSNKGYTYDNVRIISDYANLLKNKGSYTQLKLILEYMERNR